MGYLAPEMRRRVIERDFGRGDAGAGCNVTWSIDWGSSFWDMSVSEASCRVEAKGNVGDFSSVVVILDAIVPEAGNVLELASPPRAVDNRGAPFTAVVEISLVAVAEGSIATVEDIVL